MKKAIFVVSVLTLGTIAGPTAFGAPPDPRERRSPCANRTSMTTG